MELLKVGDKIRVLNWAKTYIGAKPSDRLQEVKSVNDIGEGFIVYRLKSGYGCDHVWLEEGLVEVVE